LPESINTLNSEIIHFEAGAGATALILDQSEAIFPELIEWERDGLFLESA
jgi:hypothetical protein